MKILVTGAQGQIGKALIQQLHKRQAEFLALSHAQLDITNKANVQNILFHYQPDLVINTAAYTAVDQAESDVQMAYAVNCQGISNLAETVTAMGSAIFHLSTDYVFSGNQPGNYSEEDQTEPVNIYGKSKLAGEKALASTPKHLILRTAWVFSEQRNNFIGRLLTLGHNQPRLDIVCDQFGSPTYAGDIAATLLRLADIYDASNDFNWGIYHYAGQPSVSRLDLARHLFDRVNQLGLYGHPAPELHPIYAANYTSPARRPANTSLDCTKIQKEFEIMPSNWQTAIDQLLSHSDIP